MRCTTRTLICHWLSRVVFVSELGRMSFCSLIKGITLKIHPLCFVLINSALFNLLCVWVTTWHLNEMSLKSSGRQRKNNRKNIRTACKRHYINLLRYTFLCRVTEKQYRNYVAFFSFSFFLQKAWNRHHWLKTACQMCVTESRNRRFSNNHPK